MRWAQNLKPNITLGRLFAITLAALFVLLGVLFWLFFAGSRRSILEISDRMRETASSEIAERVSGHLYQADATLNDLTSQVKRRVLDPRNEAMVEATLFAQLLSRENLDQMTLTYGQSVGFDGDGLMRLAPEGRRQITVFRAPDSDVSAADAPVITRRVVANADGFIEEFRRRSVGGAFDGTPFVRAPGTVSDPTAHLTFQTPASRDQYGNNLWSDLHWSQRDMELPAAQRRVVVTVQRTLEDTEGRFVGVLQVGLLTHQLDRITMVKLNSGQSQDPHRVFLCDRLGRLVSRVTSQDQIKEFDDDLRIASTTLPREVALALQHPELHAVGNSGNASSGRVEVDGRTFLVTFRALQRTQDWIVGIVVPEDYYLGRLEHVRNQLLIASLMVMGCILLGGVLTLRAVRRGFQRISDQTGLMQSFVFAPSTPRVSLGEVRQVLLQIENAKTALRAMGKYVPIDLVRQLYERNAEPTLGGELKDVTVMFTDIRGFTDLAEGLGPNELAAALGRYLEVMTESIQSQQGVIDKFVGDAVMAIWNAPRPVVAHPVNACAAALACVENTAKLFASPAWEGRTPLVTRFGIHTDTVIVGHFGAPSRMNFTVVGDGVNIAARLEGLNKYYGTTLLVSGGVYSQAREHFLFRRLDRVAVVGKSQSIDVYELVGRAGTKTPAFVIAYEGALGAYFERRFEEALAGFEGAMKVKPDDGPSALLAKRCRSLIEVPPHESWDGTHVWSMK